MLLNGSEVELKYTNSSTTTRDPNSHTRSLSLSYPKKFLPPMELPNLLQRGASFKFYPSTARFPTFSHHPTPRSTCLKKLWLSFLLLFLTFLAFYFVKGHHHHVLHHSSSFSSSSSSTFQPQLQGYGVAIDFGRLEARVHVLHFGDTIRVLGRENSLAPYNVPVVVENLLQFAKAYVPEGERKRTRVYMVGTGGLDWVEEKDSFLEEWRKSVRQSEFLFQDEWAMVLNGRDEGVYEWVAANYAHNVVQSDSPGTIGVLNLGAESAQVTFVADNAPPFAYSHKIDLQGTTHNLYSYSFDKLGLETASKSLLKLLQARAATSSSANKVALDPCSPRGFRGPNHFETQVAGNLESTATTVETFPTVPSGNFSACRDESLALLQQGQETCHDKNCPAGTIFVHELRGNFIATGKFYETAKYFELPDKASVAELTTAGENYCGGEVGDVTVDAFPEYEVVRKPCFSAAFIVAFLHDSLGLPSSSSQVVFTNAVTGGPVEWIVGFFLMQLLESTNQNSPPPPSTTTILLGDISGTHVAWFGGASFVAIGLLWWLVARWRRPQLKTIYDLEKGRYFTTTARGR